MHRCFGRGVQRRHVGARRGPARRAGRACRTVHPSRSSARCPRSPGLSGRGRAGSHWYVTTSSSAATVPANSTSCSSTDACPPTRRCTSARRTAAHDAPPGFAAEAPERILCLVNAPVDADTRPLTAEDIARCEATTFAKLAACGLQLESSSAMPQMVTTPSDFGTPFPATHGAVGPARGAQPAEGSSICDRTHLDLAVANDGYAWGI